MKIRQVANSGHSSSTPSDSPAKKLRKDENNEKEEWFGVQISFMKSNNICMKFQSGSCSESKDHPIPNGGSTILSHQFAVCSRMGLPVSVHPAKTCVNSPFRA